MCPSVALTCRVEGTQRSKTERLANSRKHSALAFAKAKIRKPGRQNLAFLRLLSPLLASFSPPFSSHYVTSSIFLSFTPFGDRFETSRARIFGSTAGLSHFLASLHSSSLLRLLLLLNFLLHSYLSNNAIFHLYLPPDWPASKLD